MDLSVASPSATSDPRSIPPPNITIVPGYRPSIVARTLEMHMDFYYPTMGLGRKMEGILADDLGDFLARLENPINQVWAAVMTTTTPNLDAAKSQEERRAERILGAVYVDGECSKEEGVSRLRFFIVDPSIQGLGIGGKLFKAAMDFVKEKGFRECRLSTISHLAVARKMYEKEGFKVVKEFQFDGFGVPFTSLNYVWSRPEAAGDNAATRAV